MRDDSACATANNMEISQENTVCSFGQSSETKDFWKFYPKTRVLSLRFSQCSTVKFRYQSTSDNKEKTYGKFDMLFSVSQYCVTKICDKTVLISDRFVTYLWHRFTSIYQWNNSTVILANNFHDHFLLLSLFRDWLFGFGILWERVFSKEFCFTSWVISLNFAHSTNPNWFQLMPTSDSLAFVQRPGMSQAQIEIDCRARKLGHLYHPVIGWVRRNSKSSKFVLKSQSDKISLRLNPPLQ